jgi:hypothetical protein
VQVGAVLLVLLSGLAERLEVAANVAAMAVAALTVASGADYIVRSNRMAGSK